MYKEKRGLHCVNSSDGIIAAMKKHGQKAGHGRIRVGRDRYRWRSHVHSSYRGRLLHFVPD